MSNFNLTDKNLTKAFVFPGQGSQTKGMLSDLAIQNPVILETFAEVSEAVGYDVWHLIQQDENVQLNQTEYTQVAMLTADVAIFRLLKHHDITPEIMAGHSLGEYAALVCADAIDLPGAAKLVARRGQVMQGTVPQGAGAMAAIVGLSDDDVVSLCQQASTEFLKVTPANYNAIGQVVIAGNTIAVNNAIKLAEDNGARLAKIIPVSVPCHCDLLQEAALIFKDDLQNAEFRLPKLPVISNVDLSIYESVEQIKNLLELQLYKPVRWVETIQLMYNSGVNEIIECGPAKVLNGLIKRIERSLKVISVNDEQSFKQVLQEMQCD